MPKLPRSPALVVLALACAFVAACSGAAHPASNPEAAKPAKQILADARAATARVHTVHLIVDASRKTAPALHLDLYIDGNVGAYGTASQAGITFRFVSAHGVLYLKAPAAYWAGAQSPRIRRLANRWIRLDSGTAEVSGLMPFITIRNVFNQFFASPSAVTRIPGVRDFGGTPAVGLRARQSHLYVAARGPALPVEAAMSVAAGSAQLQFAGYGRPITLIPPSHAVNLLKAAGAPKSAQVGPMTQVFDTPLPKDPASAAVIRDFRTAQVLWSKSLYRARLVPPVTSYVTGSALGKLDEGADARQDSPTEPAGIDVLFQTQVTALTGTSATVTTCDDGSKYRNVDVRTQLPAGSPTPASQDYIFETWHLTRRSGHWAIASLSLATEPNHHADRCQP